MAALCPVQVAQQLQPSVVWIEDTEKTFYRRVPHAEKLVRTPLLVTSFHPLTSSFLHGASHKGAPPPFKEICLFKEKGAVGAFESPAVVSLCPKCLSVFERIQGFDFMRHNLERKKKGRK
jgi:hypothetical protein